MKDFIDFLKQEGISADLLQEVQAFSGFAAFERSATLAVALGKLGGAWLRRLSATGSRPESRAG